MKNSPLLSRPNSWFWLTLLLAFFHGPAIAQTGTWAPAGADLSYPRTLLKAEAIPAVQASLAAAGAYAIYSSLYGSALAGPPSGNASTGNRRDRATLAKNMAFVYLLDRAAVGGTVQPLASAEKDSLLARTKRLLSQCNPAVDTAASYDAWQWRSKELIDYLIAYDLLRGASIPAADLAVGQRQLQAFATNLQRGSTTSSYGLFYGSIKNNHVLMTAAALGMAAVVLNDAVGSIATRQPQTWINTAMYNIDNLMWRDAARQSDSTTVAGYAEGPYYFKYAFLNCLPFFRAMGNFVPDSRLAYTFSSRTRRIRNPYFDPKYKLLYQWITAIQMPDGRFPALEDSYVDMGMPELALTGQSQYVKPLYLSKVSGTSLTSLTNQLRDITVDMRAAYLAANITPTLPTNAGLTALPQSGNLIFRSGNDSLASYLHVYGKSGRAQTNSGGHNQGDASSFILHAKGQLLALDPGYLSYGRRAEVGNATNHNLILVDGAGPAIGAPSTPNDAPATILKTFETPLLSYGEVQTTYPNQGTTITRKTLFVRQGYYLMADFVVGTASHTYTWQLHGYGLDNSAAPLETGVFTDNLGKDESSWSKNGARLTAHVTVTDGATEYTTATSPHETTSNTTQDHTTLLVRKSGVVQTQFLAALVPDPEASPTPALSTLSVAGTATLTNLSTEFKDLAFAQADSVATTIPAGNLPQDLQADGLVNFISLNGHDGFAQAFMEQGKTLTYGGTPIIQSSKRATTSWQQSNPTRFKGYVSRSTVLTLNLFEMPSAASGEGLASYTYNAATRQLRMEFTQASSFIVAVGGGPLPVELSTFGGQRQAWAVVLTWQTASEQNNRGFEVERQTAADPVFRPLGFVAGAGQATSPSAYTFRDAAAPAPTTYYRLRQIDFQGTYKYSPVVAVRGETLLAPTLSTFPLPAQQTLTVSFTDAETPIYLTLHNQQGQPVLRQHFQLQTVLDVSQLPAGLYFLQARNAAGEAVAKSVKVAISR